MLVKNSKKYDGLVTVFDYKGFLLHSYKSRAAFTKNFKLNPEKEKIVFSLKGGIKVNGKELEEKDMMYLPKGSEVKVESSGESVIFIAESDASEKYAPYVKKYRDTEKLKIGQPTFRRSVVTMIGEKDPANKFIAGYVEDSLGEWSSYPPHKHDDKPEAYTFFGVDPGFAIQAVLDGEEERAFVVHDYDTVLIPKGYHPHVNTSLRGSSYAWIISAPADNRNLGVEIHPAFKEVNLGKSHLTIQK
jgi:5-deoxy-glucuronate isomerase